MVHQVETMAFAHATPWHGLGINVDPERPIEHWLHMAGLDWEVELRPMMVASSLEEDAEYSIPAPSHFGLVRMTDSSVLTVTGERWNPVQNREAAEFFRTFVGAGGAKMETMGSLRGGRIVWGLASLEDRFTVAGKSDVVRGFLLLASPHLLGRAVIAKVTPVRVVCANTLALATASTGAIERRYGHQKKFDAAGAADAMGLVREDFAKFGKVANQLARLRLDDSQVLAILQPIFDRTPDSDAAPELGSSVASMAKWAASYKPNRTVGKIVEATATAPGATPGTGWGLLNGVTYYADHQSGRNPDARLAGAWFGGYAGLKQKVLASLTEMVG